MAHAGLDASVLELADSIHAAQMAEDSDGIAWGSPYGNKVLINVSIVIKFRAKTK